MAMPHTVGSRDSSDAREAWKLADVPMGQKKRAPPAGCRSAETSEMRPEMEQMEEKADLVDTDELKVWLDGGLGHAGDGRGGTGKVQKPRSTSVGVYEGASLVLVDRGDDGCS